MVERSVSMKSELVADAARATPLAAYFVSILNGVDWPAVAALLAALYTLILILEKLLKLVTPIFARKILLPAAVRDPANE